MGVDDLMEVNIYQVDVFTESTFQGNSAGVVPYAKGLDEKDMQRIANEMNLCETAFIIPIDKNKFETRFFTPCCEIELCGHATIGSFYTLGKMNYISPIENGRKKVIQKTKVGELPVELFYTDGNIDKVFMEQKNPDSLGRIDNLTELLYALNIKEEDIGIGEKFVYPEIISTGVLDLILPLKEKKTLDNLMVDFRKVSKISEKLKITGIHVFHLPNANSDRVYARNFAPFVGINEEAATGTSNGALMYFLKKNKLINSNEIKAIQGEVLGRPSVLYCEIGEKNNDFIVKVGGKARIVLEGVLCCKPT